MTEDKKCLLAQMIIARLLQNWERIDSLGQRDEYDDLTDECNDLREILGKLNLIIVNEIMARFLNSERSLL